MVRLGIDRLINEYPSWVKGNRTGVVTNYAMTDSHLHPVIDRLIQVFGSNIVKLFGPEHGIRTASPEGEHISSEQDARSGLPALSLYGTDRKPTAEMLEDVDLLIVDLQDIGTRYFTHVSTLKGVLEACDENHIRCLVLDRPNPIGSSMEGPLTEPGYTSFVGSLPIPVRHGLTLGEIARWLKRTRYPHLDLDVMALEHWQRGQYWDDTALPFVPPSPNTTGIDMMILYPGTCLFEGTNVSVGRGTTKPFEIIGAPYIDGFELAERFNQQQWPGIRARPLYFSPWRSIYAKTLCQGIQLHVIDRKVLTPFRVGIALVQLIHDTYPEHFAFLRPSHNGHDADRLFFDLLAGSDGLRKAIESGHGLDFLQDEARQLEQFRDEVAQDLLYPEKS
ncbi:Uncharacterized conserved protein YbbC, DUF1343 family [Sulfobacillus thermosulfidooxidans DSM 9293]|uniref:Uncharacterized conserved protein YbbC, DUF1343 family n=1 Tax=Sulfobacillus thermosulfidooxidans (strain DSM 9293 / VKM B-1269 / AT-1) TaxID=929705 RepID=A0A1W1WDU6_SULTA|nr:DUF1343 domain-containing protein [Sulfobacillus thermosulfidooxidans]SMC04457.1 Uncharacterized conserved protein YbbC, DUF1343 family [Sulfobacillus thermosulfidooxidans DSM 9293]